MWKEGIMVWSVRHLAAVVLLAGGTLAVPRNSAAAEPSPKAASALVEMMKSRGLEAVAAQDPANPDHFIAAMLVPDVQLLVVAGKAAAPDYLRSQIAGRQFRDVYAALYAGAVADTKLFFQDMGSDGLNPASGNIDIMYEHGTKQTIFNGDWKAQKMSRNAYEEKQQKADAEYSRLLTLLAEGLRTAAGGA
jgi:hypothetical protein